ncbi:MAG: cyclic pyranopterin monophosphate synthase MoaC [Phycisphaerales bacterium]|nr:MAG: cyclic pyranopterin monophosphate synthase MoaC [Phycisphaerales bacterium]
MEESAGMVDISGKDVTARRARAEGRIVLGREAFEVLKGGSCVKGDVLATAKIAAIQAVKSTPAIIPMCHPVLIEGIKVGFERDEAGSAVSVTVVVNSSGKTGVEMEAICGVSAACLTIYDMLKYTGKAMTIEHIRLIEKTGGKSGDYKRAD